MLVRPSRRRCLTFAVVAAAALAVVGTGPAFADDVAPPDAPGPFTTSQDADRLTITWAAPAEHGSPVTGYEVDRSTDGEQTWSVVATPADTSVTVAPPAAGSIVFYRVLADSAAGPSLPNGFGTSAPGSRPQRFHIVDTDGKPVTGDETVQWAGEDGRWSRYLDLSPDGYVTLPSVSATFDGLLRLSEGRMPTGDMVASKTWSLPFGTTTQTLIVPPAPEMVHRTIHLQMPDGTPVGFTEVQGDAKALVENTDGQDLDGFFYAYSYPGGRALDWGYTDAGGSITISGWPTENVDWVGGNPDPFWPQEGIHVNYESSDAHQENDFPLTGDDTTITLDPMPYLTSTPPATVAAGGLDAVDLTVHPAAVTSTGQQPAAQSASSPATSLAGVRVSLKPPAGWTATRCATKSTLSGVSDARGRIQLHVCGSASGNFRVVSSGAVGTGAITMHVWRGAPAAPTKVRSLSAGPGSMTTSWSAPSYLGGAPVTAYLLTLTAPGEKAVSQTVSASATSRSVNGLARDKHWTATIRAVTKYHAGTTARTTSWVG